MLGVLAQNFNKIATPLTFARFTSLPYVLTRPYAPLLFMSFFLDISVRFRHSLTHLFVLSSLTCWNFFCAQHLISSFERRDGLKWHWENCNASIAAFDSEGVSLTEVFVGHFLRGLRIFPFPAASPAACLRSKQVSKWCTNGESRENREGRAANRVIREGPIEFH